MLELLNENWICTLKLNGCEMMSSKTKVGRQWVNELTDSVKLLKSSKDFESQLILPSLFLKAGITLASELVFDLCHSARGHKVKDSWKQKWNYRLWWFCLWYVASIYLFYWCNVSNSCKTRVWLCNNKVYFNHRVHR